MKNIYLIFTQIRLANSGGYLRLTAKFYAK